MWSRIDFNLVKSCVFGDMTTKDAEGTNPAIAAALGLEFQIRDTKLFVPVVTLSKQNDKNKNKKQDLKEL